MTQTTEKAYEVWWLLAYNTFTHEFKNHSAVARVHEKQKKEVMRKMTLVTFRQGYEYEFDFLPPPHPRQDGV